MRYNNQKRIKPDTTTTRATKPFLTIPFAAVSKAAQSLGGTAFKVYLYLAKNIVDWDYSPQDVSEKMGICIDSAKSALAELENKGYLTECGRAYYQFSLYSTKENEKHRFISESGHDYGMVGEADARHIIIKEYPSITSKEIEAMIENYWRMGVDD